MVDLVRWRSREFLRFAKEQRGECCVCRWVEGKSVPAAELHHYGEKGMAQKSSDGEVARLCYAHHKQYQGKRFMAFLRDDQMEVLAAMRQDSVTLLTAYAEHMEKVAQPSVKKLFAYLLDRDEECARAELIDWLLDTGSDDIDGSAQFLLEWSSRRAADVVGFLSEPLAEIASMKGDAAFVASMALKRVGLLKGD